MRYIVTMKGANHTHLFLKKDTDETALEFATIADAMTFIRTRKTGWVWDDNGIWRARAIKKFFLMDTNDRQWWNVDTNGNELPK